jgi:hypothetical protein
MIRKEPNQQMLGTASPPEICGVEPVEKVNFDPENTCIADSNLL